jgi:SHS2 domain-containing protein
MDTAAGYRELEHIADWALEVWAVDLNGLLEQAARGMLALAGVRKQAGPATTKSFCLQYADGESLLVAFLSELLYLQEQQDFVFDSLRLELHQGTLDVTLDGVPLAGLEKEIKAVTYHNLQLRHTERGIEARIVFDV